MEMTKKVVINVITESTLIEESPDTLLFVEDRLPVKLEMLDDHVNLLKTIEALRNNVCEEEEDEEKVLGCVKNITHCPLSVTREKNRVSPDTPLVIFTIDKPGSGSISGFLSSVNAALTWQNYPSLATHEVGHIIGLDDCDNDGCLMLSGDERKKVLGWELCEDCTKKLEEKGYDMDSLLEG